MKWVFFFLVISSYSANLTAMELNETLLEQVPKLCESQINELLEKKEITKRIPKTPHSIISQKTIDLSITRHYPNSFKYEYKTGSDYFSIRAYEKHTEKNENFDVLYLHVFKNTAPYATIADESESPITAFAAHPQNKTFAIGRKDGTIVISQLLPARYDSVINKKDTVYHPDNNRIQALVYDTSGRYVFALSENHFCTFDITQQKWHQAPKTFSFFLALKTSPKEKKYLVQSIAHITLEKDVHTQLPQIIQQQKKDLLSFAIIQSIASQKQFSPRTYTQYIRRINNMLFTKTIKKTLFQNFVATIDARERKTQEIEENQQMYFITNLLSCNLL